MSAERLAAGLTSLVSPRLDWETCDLSPEEYRRYQGKRLRTTLRISKIFDFLGLSAEIGVPVIGLGMVLSGAGCASVEAAVMERANLPPVAPGQDSSEVELSDIYAPAAFNEQRALTSGEKPRNYWRLTPSQQALVKAQEAQGIESTWPGVAETRIETDKKTLIDLARVTSGITPEALEPFEQKPEVPVVLSAPTKQPAPKPEPTPTPEPTLPELTMETEVVTPAGNDLKKEGAVHVIVSGQTLSEISRLYEVPLTAILEANQIENSNLIEIGQRIIIPENIGRKKDLEISPNETILPVPLDGQNFSLSCESSAAAMVAANFQPVPPKGYSSWEDYFINAIPLNCNPHKGFRGLITGKMSTSCDANLDLGYGVYAEPVAEALRRTGFEAEVEFGVDYGQVANEVKAGNPVVVWISDWEGMYLRTEIDPEDGQEYVLYSGQHVWVISGVSKDENGYRFLIKDPAWGGWAYWSREFPNWDVFNGMRLVVKGVSSS